MSVFLVLCDSIFAINLNGMNTLEANPVRRMEELLNDALKTSISYQEYRKVIADLAAENSNSGPEKTDALANYTQLNDKRMKRWDKTLKVSESIQEQLQDLPRKVTWLVMVESWCGDAAPSLPVMNKMAQLSPNLDLKIIFRDEHEELMDLFLTNGTRSIPKLIAIEPDAKTVLGEWGPRSTKATKMVENEKAEHGKLRPEFKEELQMFYNKDKGQDILNDLSRLLTLI